MSNNQLLLQFLLAYMKWLYAGARSSEFKRTLGLCGNLRRYFDYEGDDVKSLMLDLFDQDGLDRRYPFHDHPCDYTIEAVKSLCHRNIKRNLWVYTQIERLQHEDTLPRHSEIDHRV